MSSRWSPQQDGALRAVSAWLRDPYAPQVFRMFGYAGTGKTTLARHIAAAARGRVIFAALTGKAASVLRQKGCDGARTLHSLAYHFREDPEGHPVFELNPTSEIRGAALLVLDESSMVDPELGRDILSFGVPTLVLGDPAQLPPISGAGHFDVGEPDVMLTEVHRQAAGNPILRLATTVREGGQLQPGRYGDSEVLAPGSRINVERVLQSDQILVGRNTTRRVKNDRMRQLRGFGGSLPMVGEKLVCLKNSRKRGLLNGDLWSVAAVLSVTSKHITMRIVSEVGIGSAVVKVPHNFFLGTEAQLEPDNKKRADQFGFGYALTVHKSQGSQWDDVILFDESQYFREHRARHLYTALTRAAQKVTVVQ